MALHKHTLAQRKKIPKQKGIAFKTGRLLGAGVGRVTALTVKSPAVRKQQAHAIERAKIEAHMGRYRTPGRRTVSAPLTRSQKAAARRGRLTESITPIQRLEEVLRQNKKKKE